jgi:hypothetical protein
LEKLLKNKFFQISLRVVSIVNRKSSCGYATHFSILM